jgi:hypothetical protein
MRRDGRAGHAVLCCALMMVAASGVGCRELDPFAPERLDATDHAPVTIDPSVVLLEENEFGWHGELDFTFQNLTALRISIPNCRGGFFLQLDRWDDDGWVFAWSRATFLCYSPPIELDPGASLTQRLLLHWGPPGGNWTFQPESSGDELEGTYRLVITSAYVNYESGSARGARPPLEFRVSEPFEIRLAN